MRQIHRALTVAIANAILLGSAYAAGTGDPAAQPQAPPAGEAQADAEVEKSARDAAVAELETVVVTATRRATELRDTPISVTSVSGAELDQFRVNDVLSLSRVVPGLQVRDNAIDGQGSVDINIRGIGNSNFVETGEANVSFNIDGVYTPRPQAALQLFNDVQRVEVARGPQGTLSGRNATAGSINVVPNQPSVEEVQGFVDAALETNDGWQLRGMVNLPIGETFAVRASYSRYERDALFDLRRDETMNNYIEQLTGGGLSDGNPITNVDALPLTFNTLGQNPDGGFLPYFETRYGSPDDEGVGSHSSRDQQAYRVSALWTPTENLSWLVAYEGYDSNALGSPLVLDCDRADCETYYSPNQVAQADGRTSFLSFRGSMDQDIDNWRSVIEYTFTDLFSIKYIYGSSDFDQELVQDADAGASIELGFSDMPWTANSDVNELQFTSAGEGPFDWVAGYFNFQEEIDRSLGVSFFQFGWVAFPNPNYEVETDAFYFDGTYEFNDRLTGFAGVRYTQDEKSNYGAGQYGLISSACADAVSTSPFNEAEGGVFFHAGMPALLQPECFIADNTSPPTDDSFFDYRAGLSYDLNDDVVGYLSISTGHKAQLQDQRLLVERFSPERVVIPVPTESLVNYELGFKGSLFDKRLTFSSAVFYMDYKDKQEAQFYNFGDRDCDLNGNGILDGGPTGEEAELGCGTIAGEDFDINNPIDLDDSQFSDQIEYAVVTAPKVEVYGIEFEGSMPVGDNGLLSGFLTWTHAEYKEFIYSHVVGCPNDNLDWCSPHDVSGNVPRSTPKTTLSLNYTHFFTTDGGYSFTPMIGMQYRSSYYLTPENVSGIDPSLIVQGSFTDGSGQGNVNESNLYSDKQDGSVSAYFNLTMVTPSGHWEADVYGTNIFDEDVISHIRIDTANTPLLVLEDPAQFGMRIRYRF
jgi:iron complex outermembrane receptor protein